MSLVRSGVRYLANTHDMVARQYGSGRAAATVARLALEDLAKLPRWAQLSRRPKTHHSEHPALYSPAILDGVRSLDVEIKPFRIDLAAYQAHVRSYPYPRNYAAGSMDEGGALEQKLIEYFVSLELLDIQPGQVVVDVASEYSLFPDLVRRQHQATVYRQDLIYPRGIDSDRIGGSASDMPVPDGFADKLVLHNAFEHFEGSADVDFMAEAARVLRPGGQALIVPLLVSDHFAVVTDPLVTKPDDVDAGGACLHEVLWWHNRFGRCYDAAAVRRRLLEPAFSAGLEATIWHIENVTEAHPRAYLHFGLMLRKPMQQ
jgi:SAM-dependent methyltransferase